MTNIKKFFSYLGFNDTTVNAEQVLTLIQLLSQEQSVIIDKCSTLDIVNNIIDIYISKMETNSFKVIDEQMIIESLAQC